MLTKCGKSHTKIACWKHSCLVLLANDLHRHQTEARQGNRIETAAVNKCSREIGRTDSFVLLVFFFRFRERTYANNFLFASGLLCKSFVGAETKESLSYSEQ